MMLEKKVAVITGGASGIGHAIAVGMAKEGANVVIADIDEAGAEKTEQEIRSMGKGALAVKTDVSDKNQVDALFRKAVSTYGTVDILVCSAGIMETKPMLAVTVEDWDRTWAVNVRGVMLCTQAAANIMSAKKSGKIVLISSLAAKRARADQVPYVASKGALLAFVKSAAKQLAEYNITVNAIAPGIIDTIHQEPLKNRQDKIDHIPMQRMGTPEDIIGPALFFSTDMSSYVNGTTLLVDGAYSIRLTGADY